MTRAVWGYVYWGIGWLLIGFLAAELAGYFGIAPWPTFSETVWFAERYSLVKPFVFATLITLIAHFLYHRPLWHAAAFGVLVAVGAHLADRAWP